LAESHIHTGLHPFVYKEGDADGRYNLKVVGDHPFIEASHTFDCPNTLCTLPCG